MNNEIVYKIREELISLSEEKYKDFQKNLCQGLDNIMGVRVPTFKKNSN